jgi:hypothetical protein
MRSPIWIALMSGAALIAISASSFAGTSGQATVPTESTSLQVADNQQQLPPPQGQKKKQAQGSQTGNQPRGQQYQQQPKNYVQPKTYAQPQGLQYQQKPKNYVQPKTYAQSQGQQYQQKPKNYVQPKTYAQPQGLQYQQKPKNYVQPKTYAQSQGQQYQQKPKNFVQQKTSAQAQDHRYDWRTYQPGHRPPQWQQYRQNFDPRPFEANRYAERRYHWEAYREPSGWYYQRWSYGEVFPVVFWAQEYWINSYWAFGLPNPPYGYVWVRYGPDALLVDVETGQILSVVYSLFV